MTDRTLREKISDLIEEAMVNAEVDYPVDERAGPRIEWQHEQLMEDIGALLDAHTADAVAEAGRGLLRIVEEIEGAMKHGTWRDEKGGRLKDTPEWVAFYNAARGHQP